MVENSASAYDTNSPWVSLMRSLLTTLADLNLLIFKFAMCYAFVPVKRTSFKLREETLLLI